MITFDAEMFVHGVWYIGGKMGNFIGFVYEKDDRLHFTFRIGAQDHFLWHNMDGPSNTFDFFMDYFRHEMAPDMCRILVAQQPEYIPLDCHGDDPKIFFEIGSRPWCNVQQFVVPEGCPNYVLPLC